MRNERDPWVWKWQDDAACRGMSPALFYPADDEQPAVTAARLERRVCGSCPVRDDCLAWAMQRPEVEGIWAGKSRIQRANLRRAGWVPPEHTEREAA